MVKFQNIKKLKINLCIVLPSFLIVISLRSEFFSFSYSLFVRIQNWTFCKQFKFINIQVQNPDLNLNFSNDNHSQGEEFTEFYTNFQSGLINGSPYFFLIKCSVRQRRQLVCHQKLQRGTAYIAQNYLHPPFLKNIWPFIHCGLVSTWSKWTKQGTPIHQWKIGSDKLKKFSIQKI